MVSAQKKSSKHSALSPVRLSHDRWRRTASYSSIHPSIYYHLIYRLWAERGDGWMDGRMDGFLVLSEKGSIPPPPCVSINFSLQGKRQTTLYSKHQLTEQSIKTRLKALGVVTPSYCLSQCHWLLILLMNLPLMYIGLHRKQLFYIPAVGYIFPIYCLSQYSIQIKLKYWIQCTPA